MTKLAVGYRLHEKESSQIPNLRSKYLTDILTECFRLHQVKVMKTDDDGSILLKCRQGFPITKLVSENSLFCLCKSQLRSNHFDIG